MYCCHQSGQIIAVFLMTLGNSDGSPPDLSKDADEVFYRQVKAAEKGPAMIL